MDLIYLVGIGLLVGLIAALAWGCAKLRACLVIVQKVVSRGRPERRNRSVLNVHEDAEHRPTLNHGLLGNE